MPADRWQQLKDVFQQALECSLETRRAFLDKACAGDPTLRGDVESLLASHAESEHGAARTQTLDQRGEPEAALVARREFVRVAEQIASANPTIPRFRRNLGVGYENLASALGSHKDYPANLVHDR